MNKNIQPVPHWQSSLNTLAQNGTNKNQPKILLIGKGADLADEKSLKGKAKRKVITQAMVLSLLDVSKAKKKNTDQIKSYWNTYHCQNKVYTSKGRLFSKYCKNRHCTLCTSIRKAELINKYLPVVQQWEEPYFVTLTCKSVPKKWLRGRMRNVLKAFRTINDKYRKRNQRGQQTKLMGIKSLECNFNPLKRTYNVHLHIIVPDKETADILLNEWLKLWSKDNTWHKLLASPLGQNAQKVNNNAKALIEIIKYGSKIFTEPDVNNKSNSTVNRNLYAAALNNILNAMKGLRIFERFGFDLPKQDSIKVPPPFMTFDYDIWVYEPKSHDWINTETGLYLSTYTISPELLELLKNRVDLVLE
jgi:hypothetical protein